MSAFLKIDHCAGCHRELPWEWVPPLQLHGRTLAGTGVWRSGLVNDLCGACTESREVTIARLARLQSRGAKAIAVLGGPKPFREFTFERFKVGPSNLAAFDAAKTFVPTATNLLLFGPSQVGKSHLAYAIARRAVLQGQSAVVTTPARLVRKLRMKGPDEEKAQIDAVVECDVLVLDAFGIGNDTPYLRQLLQEILDGRDYSDRYGLVVTCRWSPATLVQHRPDDGVSARLAARCRVVQIRGADRRGEEPLYG